VVVILLATLWMSSPFVMSWANNRGYALLESIAGVCFGTLWLALAAWGVVLSAKLAGTWGRQLRTIELVFVSVAVFFAFLPFVGFWLSKFTW
jgi:hypothetical protein